MATEQKIENFSPKVEVGEIQFGALDRYEGLTYGYSREVSQKNKQQDMALSKKLEGCGIELFLSRNGYENLSKFVDDCIGKKFLYAFDLAVQRGFIQIHSPQPDLLQTLIVKGGPQGFNNGFIASLLEMHTFNFSAHGVDKQKEQKVVFFTALASAIKAGNEEVVKILLSKNPQFDDIFPADCLNADSSLKETPTPLLLALQCLVDPKESKEVATSKPEQLTGIIRLIWAKKSKKAVGNWEKETLVAGLPPARKEKIMKALVEIGLKKVEAPQRGFFSSYWCCGGSAQQPQQSQSQSNAATLEKI